MTTAKILRPKPQYMWWAKGSCTVEIIKTGHYPTTVIVKLPNDAMSEVDLDELA